MKSPEVGVDSHLAVSEAHHQAPTLGIATTRVSPRTLSVAGMTLDFDGHSDIRGAAKEPARILFDMFVDDIAAEECRIAAHGVRFIRSQGKEYWGGVISTFADPDGNLVQLMEFHASAAAPGA